jgi:hypothetical protein
MEHNGQRRLFSEIPGNLPFDHKPTTKTMLFHKKKFNLSGILFLFALMLLFACDAKVEERAEGQWIKGTESEKLSAIEKHFRGFDLAMVETGYRYQELYWAGQDENWEYATYQLEKIKIAISNGLERRPKRSNSARHFLESVLPEMLTAIHQKEKTIFNSKFEMLTMNCNACHEMEKVPFFTVKVPLNRPSPIKR